MAAAAQLAIYLPSFREGTLIFFFLSLQLLPVFGKDHRPNLVKC